MNDMSLYQLSISAMLVGWFVALMLVWVRYERLPHGNFVLTGIVLWPFILTDEWLKLAGYSQVFHFIAGAFQFVPAVIAATIVLSVRKITSEHIAKNHILFFIPAILMIAGQIPFMLLPVEAKELMLFSPPMGDVLNHWPYYATYLFSAFVILSYAVHAAEYFSNYHFYLSDQVVDVDMFEMKITANGCLVMMSVAFINIAMIGIVVFDLLPFTQWQTFLNMLNAASLLFVLLLLLQKQRYSPTPFTDNQFSGKGYSEDYLSYALKQAELAIIEHKAYKRKGLRLRILADAADVEPAALALATRKILKRNFRAFIYHYRLEYAKKVLMRTDQKVTSVAKRLGFNSEKYLSNMFVKYIQIMGKQDPEETNSN